MDTNDVWSHISKMDTNDLWSYISKMDTNDMGVQVDSLYKKYAQSEVNDWTL